jgi:hypothetical protein
VSFVLAACSDDPEPAAAPRPSAATVTAPTAAATLTSAPLPSPDAPTPAAPSTDEASTPATTTEAEDEPSGPAGGCPATGESPPPGARTKPAPDVDGDGRRDKVWLAGSGRETRAGVVTASGATFGVPVTAEGSPAALAVDVDERGPVELLVNDGRSTALYVVRGCGLAPVSGPGGTPYRFGLGDAGAGTGIGCVDADGDGRRDLVVLNAVLYDTEAVIDRTVIELGGTRATLGATDTVSADLSTETRKVERAEQVTCGDVTLARDGVGR